jgi:hypothetical protein
VAYFCKGRGVCPACSTRRLVETVAHLTDHVSPRLPVRQWVLSVPKQLRFYMQRDGAALHLVLRNMSEGAPGVTPLGHAVAPTPEPAPPKRAPAHYLWAVLIASIYEVFPLLWPLRGEG